VLARMNRRLVGSDQDVPALAAISCLVQLSGLYYQVLGVVAPAVMAQMRYLEN
jgi:predicted transporter